MTTTDTLWAGGQIIDGDAADLSVQPTALALRDKPKLAGSDYSEFVSTAIDLPARDPRKMVDDARRVGSLLGRDAFYSWRQSGAQIEGPTIDLAYALAQTWGRCVTRTTIIDRDDNKVHLRGVFVDLQQLSIVERDYIAHIAAAPGKYAEKEDQAARWDTMQLQSASSKAVRGAILGGLPAWFVNAAMEAARDTASNRATGGKSLPEARTAAGKLMFDEFGLTQNEAEAWLQQPMAAWAVPELEKLRRLYSDLKHGRITIETVRGELAAESAPKASKRGLRSGQATSSTVADGGEE